MHFKLKYWDNLFKTLIDWHLTNGNKFESEIINRPNGSSLMIERFHDDPNVFLRYTFFDVNGAEVAYAVTCACKVKVHLVRDQSKRIQFLNNPNKDVELIMRDCYKVAVDIVESIWYE